MTRNEIINAMGGILNSCSASDCRYSCPFRTICNETEVHTCCEVIEEVIARAEQVK